MNPSVSKRDQILRTAFELFTSSSYHTVSIDDILGKAGASKGALFHHFSNKYELASESFLKILDEEWIGRLSDLESVANPAVRIQKFIDFSVDMAIDNPKLMRFALELMEEGEKRGEDGEQWRDFLDHFVKMLGAMLAECNVPNPYIKAELLLASLDAISLQTAFFKGAEAALEPALLKTEIFEVFVGNYTQRSKGEHE